MQLALLPTLESYHYVLDWILHFRRCHWSHCCQFSVAILGVRIMALLQGVHQSGLVTPYPIDRFRDVRRIPTPQLGFDMALVEFGQRFRDLPSLGTMVLGHRHFRRSLMDFRAQLPVFLPVAQAT